MKKLILFLVVAALVVPAITLAKMKAPDILDNEKIMTDEGLSKYSTIGVKLFSTDGVEYENVDEEEMRNMSRFVKECRMKLARTIAHDLEDKGFKAHVIEDGDDAGKADMVIEGKITKFNLGSFGARFFGGFGAGQAGITVEGQLVEAKGGKSLAKFEHENTSGLSEGDKWNLVLHECEDLGDKIADFVDKLR